MTSYTFWLLLAVVAFVAVLRDLALLLAWPVPIVVSATADGLLLKVLIITLGGDVVLAVLREPAKAATR